MEQKIVAAIKKAFDDTGLIVVSAEEYARLELSNSRLQEEIAALELRIKSLLTR